MKIDDVSSVAVKIIIKANTERRREREGGGGERPRGRVTGERE